MIVVPPGRCPRNLSGGTIKLTYLLLDALVFWYKSRHAAPLHARARARGLSAAGSACVSVRALVPMQFGTCQRRQSTSGRTCFSAHAASQQDRTQQPTLPNIAIFSFMLNPETSDMVGVDGGTLSVARPALQGN